MKLIKNIKKYFLNINYKEIIFILTLIFLIGNTFAIQIIDPNQPINPTEPVKTFKDSVIQGVVIGIALGLIGGILWWIIQWIAKKFKDAQRKHKDLIYFKFLHEVNLCNINRDSSLKYRDWKWFFLAWKRTPIYIRNEEGLRLIGLYDGELNKKEGFKLLSIYSKKNFFTGENYILIIPYQIRQIMKKESYGGKISIIIESYGLDEVGNNDYYLMPIIKNLEGDSQKPFLDFNDFISKEYFEKYILREIIKDTQIRSTEAVEKATEMNPNIQVSRKDPKQ